MLIITGDWEKVTNSKSDYQPYDFLLSLIVKQTTSI
ncbi:MAG: hypothetical protein ACI8PD_002515 [Nitrospinales bacterium]|jgi:hypothetical protein